MMAPDGEFPHDDDQSHSYTLPIFSHLLWLPWPTLRTNEFPQAIHRDFLDPSQDSDPPRLIPLGHLLLISTPRHTDHSDLEIRLSPSKSQYLANRRAHAFGCTRSRIIRRKSADSLGLIPRSRFVSNLSNFHSITCLVFEATTPVVVPKSGPDQEPLILHA